MNVWLWMSIVFFLSAVLWATTYRMLDFPLDSAPQDNEDARRRASWAETRKYVYMGVVAMCIFAGLIALLIGYARMLQ